jgi:hypothetical protein
MGGRKRSRHPIWNVIICRKRKKESERLEDVWVAEPNTKNNNVGGRGAEISTKMRVQKENGSLMFAFLTSPPQL